MQDVTFLSASPVVVELNRSDSDQNVFCIHPAGGGVEFYRDCAEALAPSAKMYGLDDPYIYGGHDYESFPELAELHLDAIRAIQPSGPYMLMGYCSGGPLAFEIGCQLEIGGESVSRVSLMGCEVLLGFDAEWGRFAVLEEYLQTRYGIELGHLDWPSFEGMGIDPFVEVIIGDLVRQGIEPVEREPNWAIKTLAGLCRYFRASSRYRPPRASFDIDLYRRHLPENIGDQAREAKAWCDWSSITTGRLSIVDAPEIRSSHGDIMHAPYLDHTVGSLMTALRTA